MFKQKIQLACSGCKSFVKLHTKQIIVLVSILIVSFTATLVYRSLNQEQVLGVAQESEVEPLTMEESDEQIDVTRAGLPPLEEINALNILLVGYGGPGHQGGYLADVIQVARFDFANSKLVFISIPRDLWVSYGQNQQGKINNLLANGVKNGDVSTGANYMKQAIFSMTGLEIDYFVAVDFVGFQRAIGTELGGIEVNVAETLDDAWYPVRGLELETCGMTSEEVGQVSAQYSGFELEKQFPCRYKHVFFEAGKTHHMEGGDALEYVRSRHGSDGGDFSRSKRQQEVLLGIRDKLFSLNALDNVGGFFKQLAKHTQADFDVSVVKYLVPLLKNTQGFEVKNIVLSTANVLTSSKSSAGAYIIVPKDGMNQWGGIKGFVQSQL